MRRTTYIFLALVFLLAAFPVLGSTLQDIYQNITKSSDRITPDSYRVRVENESFNEALAELPEEIRTGKAEPAVMIYFEKGDGVKIVIENIRSEYASLFSMYEDYLKFSGISNVQNPKEFKEIIDQGKVKLHEEDGNTVILKAWDPEQEGRGDNYAFFTLNKSKWVIVKALYYLDGTPYVQAENKYKDIGKYYLPYEIVLMNLVDNSSEVFRFMEYQFK